RPDFVEALNNLGIALSRKGKYEEAVTRFRTALRIRPDYLEAYNNMGLALAELGRTDEAVASFEEALKFDPNYDKAFNNLIAVLMKAGRFKEVERKMKEGLRRRPEDMKLAMSLAWFLSTCPDPKVRDGRRAVELAEEVCLSTGYRDARALDVLAAAYAEEGRFEEAIKVARRAVRLAFSSGMGSLAKEVEGRIELYRKHRAYHGGP
ncbi:MAG TPA: tetratricopeptide repeat protein, partial [Candidatus Latescibacteria bacterium]|nr:tetratricopeptide repeat protein [Candidatus Latescibacterota bacterium]